MDYKTDYDVKRLIQQMEDLANAPKEEFGKRQPGEKGGFERQAVLKPVEHV